MKTKRLFLNLFMMVAVLMIFASLSYRQDIDLSAMDETQVMLLLQQNRAAA